MPILVIFLMLFCNLASAGELLTGYKYNPYQGTYQYGSQHTYNPMTRKMETTVPGQELQYDYYNRKWIYASPDAVLRFNPMSNTYEQASPQAVLRQNPMTREWTYEAK